MYPNYFMVFKAALLVFGLLWCKEILARFGKDIAELRGEANVITKGIIVLFWFLTAGVVMIMWTIIEGIVQPLLNLL